MNEWIVPVLLPGWLAGWLAACVCSRSWSLQSPATPSSQPKPKPESQAREPSLSAKEEEEEGLSRLKENFSIKRERPKGFDRITSLP